MNEIQLTCYSVGRLFDRDIWFDFFYGLEKLLNVKLSHLDTSDPVRKKVDEKNEAADYVCLVGEHEGSRKLFGKLGKSKIRISISLYKDTSRFPNSISLYFPATFLNASDSADLLYDIFLMANRCFQPFYSICDSISVVASKRKSTGFSVSLQAELIGVFWLTYLNKHYVDFFGLKKLVKLPCQYVKELDGVTIRLGESPLLVDISRTDAENILGKDSFVDPLLGIDKIAGKNALMFSQLNTKPPTLSGQ